MNAMQSQEAATDLQVLHLELVIQLSFQEKFVIVARCTPQGVPVVAQSPDIQQDFSECFPF